MRKKLIIAAVALVVFAGLWWIVKSSGSSAAAGMAAGGRGGPAGGMAVPVVATEVVKRDVPIYLDGLGTVQAFNAVTVRVRVDGQLMKVLFVEGQEVKSGDELALIDPRSYQAALDQAVAKKAQDEAQLANARAILNRNSELMAKKVLDQQTFETSKAQVDQFVATVQGDQAMIDSALTQLTYTRVVSPIDGRVGLRQIDQGNVVHASDQNGLVVITQLRPISVVFTLPQQNLRLINQSASGQTLAVTAMDRDNRTPLATGVLTVVDNQIDPTTGTIKLKAMFPNDDFALWPGQFVNTRLLVNMRKDAIVVPAPVVQRGPQGSYAYVIKSDMTVEMRTITVAQIEAGMALIDDGLTVGEKVVVDGQYKLQPGSKVEISGADRARPPQQLGQADPAAKERAGEVRKARSGGATPATKSPNES